MIIVEFVKVLRGTLGNSPKNSPNLCGEFEKKSRHVGKDIPCHPPVQDGMHKVQELFFRLKEYVPADGFQSIDPSAGMSMDRRFAKKLKLLTDILQGTARSMIL